MTTDTTTSEVDELAGKVFDAVDTYVSERLRRQAAEVAGAIDALGRVTQQLGERLSALERKS